MRKRKLKYFVQPTKQDKLKRSVVWFLALLLLVAFGTNFTNFAKAIRKFTYENYLESLYERKKTEGIGFLSEINSSFVAYIEIEDIEMHLPVVRAKDASEEDFYLNHDFKKGQNELGTPYEKSTARFDEAENVVLIGHSAFNESFFGMSKNQSIFGRLNDYLQVRSTYNYKITIETLNAVKHYKIIGVVRFKASETTSDGYSIYATSSIKTQSQFNKFYSAVKNNSVIKNLDTASFGDKFVTLFTCATANLDYRVMVIAKEV